MLPGQIGRVRPAQTSAKAGPVTSDSVCSKRIGGRFGARFRCSRNPGRVGGVCPAAAGQRAGIRRSLPGTARWLGPLASRPHQAARRGRFDCPGPAPFGQFRRGHGRISVADIGLTGPPVRRSALQFSNSRLVSRRCVGSRKRNGRTPHSRCGATPRGIRKAGFVPYPSAGRPMHFGNQKKKSIGRFWPPASPLWRWPPGPRRPRPHSAPSPMTRRPASTATAGTNRSEKAGRGRRHQGLRLRTSARSSSAPRVANAARSR